MSNTCPSCGAAATGKFCAQCGAALETPACAECGNQIPAGGRFCNMCGTPVAGGGKGKRKPKEPVAAAAAAAPAAHASRNLPWFVAGAAVVALAGVMIFSGRGDETPDLPPATPPAGPALGGAGGDPSSVDLSSMTPREAADRLFNRVMTAVSNGDTAQARGFAPMAVSAYEMVDGLDVDGRYHLAVIHLVNNQPEQALATATTILADEPTHLFGHFTAAEAEQALGNREAAETHYREFLTNFDAEVASGRDEYTEHAAVLPSMRQQAAQFAGG